MAAYCIYQIEITDPELYKDYVAQVPATVAKFEGEYLARGGRSETLEGQWPDRRTVILKFPSYEHAKRWHESEEYAGPKAIRLAASEADALLIDGV